MGQTRLTTQQTEALLHLQRVQLRADEVAVQRSRLEVTISEAQAERARQMQRCWDLGIPATRIGDAANVSKSAITRRFAASYGGET